MIEPGVMVLSERGRPGQAPREVATLSKKQPTFTLRLFNVAPALQTLAQR